jgi:hypothetical protein
MPFRVFLTGVLFCPRSPGHAAIPVQKIPEDHASAGGTGGVP